MVGVVDLQEALRQAAIDNLDLVEISPGAVPPVCKILDFGKYKYDAKKRLHEAKKKQKVITIKEIKLRPNISPNDLEIKIRNIRKFLEDEDKVKVSLWFRGREIVHSSIGLGILQKVLDNITCTIESPPKFEGKQVIMVVAPSKNIK